MSKYRKLIVALVGLGLLVLHRRYGVDLTGESAAIVDLVLAALTAAGVYTAPNEEV